VVDLEPASTGTGNAAGQVSAADRGPQAACRSRCCRSASWEIADDYFSVGISDDIATALGRFPISRSRRRAWSHVSQRRDQYRRHAAPLKVQYLVEGSVRQDAGRVRVASG
jgi:TolB-like protein